MNKIKYLAVFFILSIYSSLSFATLNIFACEPEWASLTQEITGNKASIYTATTAKQDVHHIQARPSLIAKIRSADLVVCTGADLEIGWLPVLIRDSGNPKIQENQLGYFEASRYVKLLEIPNNVDRIHGDVHPKGNPHIQTDPHRIAQIAEALTQRLIAIDPTHQDFYKNNHLKFSKRWKESIQQWELKAKPLINMPIVYHHQGFAYLNQWLKLKPIAYLEPKAGSEPSAVHLSNLLNQLKNTPAKAIIYAPYNNPKSAQWLSEKTKTPIVMLPFSVGGNDQSTNLFSFFDETINQLLKYK